MFVKEDKKGQHYYSLIFYISQSEYRKRSEADCNVNVWEEPGDTLISKLSEHLSLTSVSALSNWTSREVADCSNKVFSWWFNGGTVGVHLLCTELKESKRVKRRQLKDRGTDGRDASSAPSSTAGFLLWDCGGCTAGSPALDINQTTLPNSVDGKC